MYLYPEDTIHFSLINIFSLELSVDFEDARRVIENQKWFKDFLEYANQEIIKKFKETRFVIKKFYTKDNSIKGSLSLNIKSETEDWVIWLKELEEKIYPELEKLKLPNNNFGIKYPGDHFVINLLRFFGEDDESLGESFTLEKLIEKHPILNKSFKVSNPVIVISDQYLSNKTPQIIPYN